MSQNAGNLSQSEVKMLDMHLDGLYELNEFMRAGNHECNETVFLDRLYDNRQGRFETFEEAYTTIISRARQFLTKNRHEHKNFDTTYQIDGCTVSLIQLQQKVNIATRLHAKMHQQKKTLRRCDLFQNRNAKSVRTDTSHANNYII